MSDRTVKRAPRWFYQVARTVVITFCKIWFRVSYEGTDRLPKDASYVIAPIHRSNVDTFVVGCMTRRRVRFMAKDSLWKVKPLGVFIETVGGFPVRRGSADVEAIKTALGLLAEGEPVVLFPEGARQTGPIVQPLFDGAVYVAAKGGSADRARRRRRLGAVHAEGQQADLPVQDPRDRG